MKQLRGERHFFDARGIDIVKADNVAVMCEVLAEVNRIHFGGTGYVEVKRVRDEQNPVNNGVSGMILSSDTHFICRTFSQRGILFADFATFRKSAKKIERITTLLKTQFDCECVEFCRESTSENIQGSNLVVELSQISAEVARRLTDWIHLAIEAKSSVKYLMSRTESTSFGLLRVGATSYVAIHSYGKPRVVLDVFSCYPFAVEDVIEVLRSAGIFYDSWYITDRSLDLIQKAF